MVNGFRTRLSTPSFGTRWNSRADYTPFDTKGPMVPPGDLLLAWWLSYDVPSRLDKIGCVT